MGTTYTKGDAMGDGEELTEQEKSAVKAAFVAGAFMSLEIARIFNKCPKAAPIALGSSLAAEYKCGVISGGREYADMFLRVFSDAANKALTDLTDHVGGEEFHLRIERVEGRWPDADDPKNPAAVEPTKRFEI